MVRGRGRGPNRPPTPVSIENCVGFGIHTRVHASGAARAPARRGPVARATRQDVDVAELNVLNLWRVLLGDNLAGFLLGVTSGAEVTIATPGAAEVLGWLEENLGRLQADDPRLPVALVQHIAEDGLPTAWSLRRRAGGHVASPDVGAGDQVDRHVAHIARDVFPVLLAPPDPIIPGGGQPGVDLTDAVSAHQLAASVDDALHTEGVNTAGTVLVSARSVTRMSHVSAAAIMGSAALRLRHAPERDAEAFMALARAVLADLRAAMSGDPIPVAARIGLAGLVVPRGIEVEVPQGRLRAPSPEEARYAPLSFLAGAVLETTVVGQLLAEGGDIAALQITGQERLGRVGREICLAVALGSEMTATQACPAIAWVTELAPLGGAGAFRPLHPAQPPPAPANRLGDDELAGIATWAERIARADLSHVEIAVDRILRALWEVEWTESLIDAVIAWESLLGTRTETMFRVTAALAVLCEDNPQHRQTLRNELQRVYDARSRLVHGDQPEGPLHEYCPRAIATALEALRRLIRDRPDLLGLARSSARAERLLLGVTPATHPASADKPPGRH
jgi:Apea-like HEPN